MKNKMKDLLDKLSKIQTAAKKKAKEQGKKKVKKKWKKILDRVSVGTKLSKLTKLGKGFKEPKK